jgi:hypothetical protein
MREIKPPKYMKKPNVYLCGQIDLFAILILLPLGLTSAQIIYLVGRQKADKHNSIGIVLLKGQSGD